ncbi:membrane dipeptidase [Duganella sp. FT80W]|uniref:Membrane dipeptidase n=1 Tax=Duganella guangzhouensis TaxID=2666084 RepID=A0A6I2KYN8_9BURK|nr:dipeptidase [Duganella guangzhouensis]MRW90622.1 membrane dipeptidase [Duganella guangzhouensis]
MNKILYGLIAGLLLGAVNAGAADGTLEEQARQIHQRIIAIDSHVDLPFDYPGAAADGNTQIDLPKVARGQLKGAALAVFVPQGPRTAEGYAKAQQDADKKYQLIKAFAEDNPDKAALAYTPADVQRIAGQGKFAVLISVLNAYPLGADLGQLDVWYQRGVRVLGYTHAGNNAWSDSSRPSKTLNDRPDENGGLSDLGKQGVARLNQLGILIDVSQLTTPALKQVLSLTKAPVVATHSGLKAIVDAPRNLSDEELDLIKQNGGVVQVVAFSNYLRKAPEGVKAAPATVAQLVDAIAYATKRIGVDHVGIASDFNHGGGVEGWQNEGEAQNVTVELLRRGYSERDIAKLWGGNFLRVLGEAQQRAATR